MTCPHCQSTGVRRRGGRTALGYRRFACLVCHQRFNERTGTPFNDLQFPTDIVFLAVLWRLRYKLGLLPLRSHQTSPSSRPARFSLSRWIGLRGSGQSRR